MLSDPLEPGGYMQNVELGLHALAIILIIAAISRFFKARGARKGGDSLRGEKLGAAAKEMRVILSKFGKAREALKSFLLEWHSQTMEMAAALRLTQEKRKPAPRPPRRQQSSGHLPRQSGPQSRSGRAPSDRMRKQPPPVRRRPRPQSDSGEHDTRKFHQGAALAFAMQDEERGETIKQLLGSLEEHPGEVADAAAMFDLAARVEPDAERYYRRAAIYFFLAVVCIYASKIVVLLPKLGGGA